MEKKFLNKFLEELSALENFRSEHKSSYKNTPLSQGEDPDTKRLIEALAFFTTRSKIGGEKAILKTHERLFSQYFPSLLSSMPAMNLVEFEPSLRMSETIELKKGAKLRYTTSKGAVATFQTLERRVLTPLKIINLEQSYDNDGTMTLAIDFFSSQAILDTLSEITLHLNHLSSFASSIEGLSMLLQHAHSVEVSYIDKESNVIGPLPSKLALPDKDNAHIFCDPISRIRSFLHLPEQHLFFQIVLPPSPTKWQGLKVNISLGKSWPKSLQFNSNSFSLNIVPCANLIQSEAAPIRCRGEKDYYPILPNDPTLKCQLHSVKGVYKISDTVWEPLRPGILGALSDSYEVSIRESRVSLNLKDSELETKVVIVDSIWTQPWFSDLIHEEFSISFYRNTPGVKPRLFGAIQPHEKLESKEDPDHLLRILTLKNQTKLSLEELLFLLHMLKPLHESPFKGIEDLIKELHVNQPYDPRGISSSIIYHFKIKQGHDHNWCVILSFFKMVHEFLNTWLATFQLETCVSLMNGKMLATYKGPRQHELPILATNFF